MTDTRTGVSWTCIGFFGTPRHDLCNVVGCTCACHRKPWDTALLSDEDYDRACGVSVHTTSNLSTGSTLISEDAGDR